MEMHQVRYFLALCRELNFTRAARSCDVAQPSLTNAIKRLECELAGTLFDRDSKGTRLTKLGLLVRPHFEMLDQCVAGARRAATRFKGRGRAKNGLRSE